MSRYTAPAKVNLSLLVRPPSSDGFHPIESLVQVIEWCDTLEVTPSEEGKDSVSFRGGDIDAADNLVTRALGELRRLAKVPPLSIEVAKEIPIGAGLGGGSSDAAATLLAGVEEASLVRSFAEQAAPSVGSDVPLFLVGGTMVIGGRGEQIVSVEELEGFALALAVPDFPLSTADVYRKWDEMEGPEGDPVPIGAVPPNLREGMPLRNDLLPAALALAPLLGDFMADLRRHWDTAVSMTGSGSACFAFFSGLDEAKDAAEAVSAISSVSQGVSLRSRGVERLAIPET